MGADFTIIGTWELKSFVTRFEDGTCHLPYGENPEGRITYTKDGFMSAHLWNPDKHTEGAEPSDDPNYFSYCGDWFIEDDRVRHRVHAATHPSWTGEDRFRTMKHDGKHLELTAENVIFEGKNGRGVLIWRPRK